ncbi:hypothetical protein JCM14076_20320 [Methylosoma difficile]
MAKPTIFEVAKSVIAAFTGVQSDENRERDFQEGSLKTYIVAGLIFTIAFVGGLIILVSVVLG